MGEGDYRINNIYQGGYSSLKPETYSPDGLYTGFNIPSSQLGTTTRVDTANQLGEVIDRLNQGIIPIEVGSVMPEVFEAIPKEQFKEINRMAKLTGAKISVHAPIVEPSGIGDQGWDEASRQLAEKQLISVIDRTAPMNEKGSMPITIHSSAKIPGIEYRITPEGKKVEEKIYAINRETGKITTVLKREEKFLPGTEEMLKGKAKPYSPVEELDKLNNSEWDNSISQLMHHKEDADKIMSENLDIIPKKILQDVIQDPVKKLPLLDPVYQQAYHKILSTDQFLHDTHALLNSLFHKAYKYGTKDDKEKLLKASKNFGESLEQNPSLPGKSQAIGNLLNTLKGVHPTLYETAEDFALDKSAKTFANVALYGLEKYQDKAPVINIENVPGLAFSHSEELDRLIKETRRQFIETAVSKGYSKSKAEQEAEKLIGITLDIGHLNIARKEGFTEKDLLNEVKALAKNVKHVHLSDNFGSEHIELPIGMGNVPAKEILAELEKAGYTGRNILEAAHFVQHFKKSPMPYLFEAFGSPIYGGGPSWNQTTGLIEGYSGGFGEMLPQTHYQIFGAGFAQLPKELGGSLTGQGSRMSGRPME